MKFLYPYFLFLLAAIIIPILIHLFNFRRYKTVLFSNVEFLKHIKKESKKKSRLKQLLILIARILAIASLVFAFAQPFIPAKNQKQNTGKQVVAIFVDNSFSMNINAESGLLIESARNKAAEIAKEYAPGTKFRLITNDLFAKHKHYFNKEQFIQQVSEISVSAATNPLSKIYNKIVDSFLELDDQTGKTIYLLSDFQKNISDLQNFRADTTVQTYLIPRLPAKVNNLYIDSCWFETPGRKLGEEELFVKIINDANEEYQNLPLRLFLNDTLKAINNFNIGAQSEITVNLNYANLHSGLHYGKVELTDYPLTYDNSYFISYDILPEVKTLAIYADTPSSKEGLRYMQALFEEDPLIHFETMNMQNLHINRFSEFNVFILLNLPQISGGLDNELQKAATKGASVMFFPDIHADIGSYNQFLEGCKCNTIIEADTTAQKLAGVAYSNILFKDIFTDRDPNPMMPEIKEHFRFTDNTKANETSLLWFANNNKALAKSSFDDGTFYRFSFPLQKTNASFATNILFVPVVYSIVLNSLPRQTISYNAGNTNYVLINQSNFSNKNYPLSIKNRTTQEEFIPQVTVNNTNNLRIDLSNGISQAGHYEVISKDSIVTALAFNYNRDESGLIYFTSDDLLNAVSSSGLLKVYLLENAQEDFSAIFEEIEHGKRLWKFFILTALFFVLAEACIIRFWKS